MNAIGREKMTDSGKNIPGRHTVVVMEGDLTVENAVELKEKLRAAIEKSESVVIQCNDSARIDISFLQLACAAYRTALDAGRNLKLSAAIPESLMRAVQSAGFAYHPVWNFDSNRGKEMGNGGGNE
jgi:anti-anti-sigma regulatory factor